MYRISNEHKPSIRLMNLLIDLLLRILGKIKGVEYAYNLKDYDEVMEYVWCKPELTGLPVDLFADDGGSYKMHKHLPLVMVRNGYSDMVGEFIPLSISDNPIVLDRKMEIAITPEELKDVKTFIRMNKEGLLKLANDEIVNTDFLHSIRAIKTT